MKKINEASYSRIYQHAKDSGTFAIVGSEDKDTHQDRYNELKQLVKTYEHNYEHLGYNRLAGTYKYQDTGEVANEKSLIIYGISKEDALKIAKAINQESIIWKDATFFGIIDADGNVIQTFSKATLNRSKAEKQGIGSKLRSDQNNTYGYAFEGVKGMNKKRLSESIMMYIKESESPISYESFKGQILNDVEMYEENMMYDDEDVFGGTEDSYANEMIEQNLFDTIYYNIKHNYMSDDAAGNTATQVMWYLLDAIKDGTIDEKIIKEVYDKYVADKKGK